MNNKLQKILPFILVIVVILLAVFLLSTDKSPYDDTSLDDSMTQDKATNVVITDEDINEANFTGKKAVFQGEGFLIDQARNYTEESVALFRDRANEEVPAMLEEFGPESPAGNYYIGIEGEYVKGQGIESIALSQYEYTGGANGLSFYKVFTHRIGEDQLLALRDIIKPEMQNAFVDKIKKDLKAWTPYDTEAPVVFEEDVDALTIDSFTNWSMDQDNLNIYFSKYEIGPGALGAVVFPLPLSELNEYLNI